MTDQAMSPLRRRMIKDMTIRKFAQKTYLVCRGRQNSD
jgi:integrase/recombinase XerD